VVVAKVAEIMNQDVRNILSGLNCLPRILAHILSMNITVDSALKAKRFLVQELKMSRYV
jgi:hypothetical protein